ncbi:MAG: DUF58 domain-containing protein [Pirellulaceae bacterium]
MTRIQQRLGKLAARADETHQASTPGHAGRWLDASALMRIKNLQMRAKVIVEGFLTGLHRSPFHGFSVEFSEYRQYTPGDDLRFMDWRLLARTDRYFVKRFEDETNLRCYLLLDASRSMGFGSLAYTKYEYARTLVATLAYFLARQRDAAGLVTFDQQVVDYMPARFRPGHLHRLLLCLERSLAGKSTDLAAPLDQIARTVRKRGLVVLISDLLTPWQTLDRQLGYLRSLGHEVLILRVLDPGEVNFQFRDAVIFEDAESGRELYVDPDAVRRQYLQRFQEHADSIRKTCADLGIDYRMLTTDQPLEMVLFDFLSARQRFNRLLIRRPGAAQGGKA